MVIFSYFFTKFGGQVSYPTKPAGLQGFFSGALLMIDNQNTFFNKIIFYKLILKQFFKFHGHVGYRYERETDNGLNIVQFLI
jgi:hypothetical protein